MKQFLLTFVIGCLPAAAGVAAPTVHWLDGSPATTQKVREAVENIKDASDKPLVFRDRAAWVAHRDYAPLQSPQGGADKSGADPLPWLQRVNLLYDQTDSPFALVGSGQIGRDLVLLGWVPKTSLIRDIYATREGSSTLYRKASVINSQKFVNERKEFMPARYRTVPDRDAKPDGVLRVLSINFIWGDTNPASESDGHYLLGASSALSLRDLAQEKTALGQDAGILGWVEKGRVVVWGTREGLMWDPSDQRSGPAAAFLTEKDAENSLAPGAKVTVGGTRPAELPANTVWTDTGEEPFVPNEAGKLAPRPWPANKPRHPLMPMTEGKETVFLKKFGTHTLRKIAFVGNVITSKNEEVVSAEAYQSFQQKLTEMETKLQKSSVEMLFVIDDTESMEQWYGKTVEAVDQVLAGVAGSGRPLRVGFAFYSDVPEEDRKTRKDLLKAVETGKLTDAASAEYKERKQKLATGRGTRKGIDSAEQVYLGLTEGIRNAGWSTDGESRQIVILLGDTCDHANPKTNPGGPSLDDVVDALCPPKARPIEFYAYQVTGKTEEDHKRFVVQMEAIAEEVNKKSEKLGHPRRAELIRGAVDLAKALKQYYDQATSDMIKLEQSVADLKRGNISAENLSGFDNPDAIRLVKQFLKEEIARGGKVITDDPKAFLKQLSESVQVYDYRYVFEEDPANQRQTQARVQLLFSIDELTGVGKMLNEVFSRRPIPSAKEIAEAFVDAQAGDKRLHDELIRELKRQNREKKDLTEQQLLDRMSGNSLLKIKFGVASTSPLLQATRSDLEGKATDDVDYAVLAGKVVRKVDLINEGLLKRQDVEPDDTGKIRVIRKWDTGLNRWFLLDRNVDAKLPGSGFEWIWLDFEREWP